MDNTFCRKTYVWKQLVLDLSFFLGTETFENCLAVLFLLKTSLELKKKTVVLPLCAMRYVSSKANGWAKTKYVFRFTMHGGEAAISQHSWKGGEKAEIKREDRSSEMRRECLLFSSKRTKEHQRAYRNVF